jgi:two-component SAPR family response regulator
MKILCVDDEELILALTVSMCRGIPGPVEAVGFTRSAQALEWLERNEPEIALLDINMADMHGLALAAKIKTLRPDTAIIFLTGYSEYAVDAFALHASGYLLKPVSQKRLEAEIAHALRGRPVQKPTPHIFAKTFGSFDLFVDGRPVAFSRARSKELLAYLIDRQGSGVTRPQIFAALWEDVPYDRSRQKQLDVVIRSLRATLEEAGILEILDLRRGALRVIPEKLDCDLYRFLDGDAEAVNSFRGEYMSAYPWAGLTESFMDQAYERMTEGRK